MRHPEVVLRTSDPPTPPHYYGAQTTVRNHSTVHIYSALPCLGACPKYLHYSAYEGALQEVRTKGVHRVPIVT
jgi:hypothetical protein